MFYYLPNKRPVDVEGAIDAMLDTNQAHQYFLDTTTGYVGCVGAEDEEEYSRLKSIRHESNRYLELPRVSDDKKKAWLETFAGMIVLFDDAPFYEILLGTLRSAGFESAYTLLISYKDGEWAPAWESWVGDHAFEDLGVWLKQSVSGSTHGLKGYDNCAICHAHKNGAGLHELLDAFEEQRGIDEDMVT
jgi:hypothetical protein